MNIEELYIEKKTLEAKINDDLFNFAMKLQRNNMIMIDACSDITIIQTAFGNAINNINFKIKAQIQ